jgi:hypothetical protein
MGNIHQSLGNSDTKMFLADGCFGMQGGNTE